MIAKQKVTTPSRKILTIRRRKGESAIDYAARREWNKFNVEGKSPPFRSMLDGTKEVEVKGVELQATDVKKHPWETRDQFYQRRRRIKLNRIRRATAHLGLKTSPAKIDKRARKKNKSAGEKRREAEVKWAADRMKVWVCKDNTRTCVAVMSSSHIAYSLGAILRTAEPGVEGERSYVYGREKFVSIFMRELHDRENNGTLYAKPDDRGSAPDDVVLDETGGEFQ